MLVSVWLIGLTMIVVQFLLFTAIASLPDRLNIASNSSEKVSKLQGKDGIPKGLRRSGSRAKPSSEDLNKAMSQIMQAIANSQQLMDDPISADLTRIEKESELDA